jgi:hypothetical protein
MTLRAHRTPKYLLGVVTFNTDDSILLADGTLWSHAATLGTRSKGDTFTIDRPTVENMVKVFTSGYPQKVPVDYEHGSTSADPEIRKLRAQGQVPKAGDVLELRGVFSADDFTGDLKTAAEKLAKDSGRELSDPRNFGLWQRWKPTARALTAIKNGEYSELSIAFDEDWPNNTTGDGQGPTLLAVGLVMRPFLDDMLPVAASAVDDLDPDEPGKTSNERTMTQKVTMLSSVAAMLGKAVSNEDEAIAELTTFTAQTRTAREFAAVVGAELGEPDPVKAATAIRELKAQVKTATDAAAEQKKTAVKTAVEATMEKHKTKLTVPLRELFSSQLATELEAGVKLEETKTVKALESMKSLSLFEQSAAPDVGGAAANDDDKIEALAQQLLESNSRFKQLAATNRFEAYKEALIEAERQFRSTRTA